MSLFPLVRCTLPGRLPRGGRAVQPMFATMIETLDLRDATLVGFSTGGGEHAPRKLIKGSKLIVYQGGPHGITDTHKDQLNQDLLNFLRE